MNRMLTRIKQLKEAMRESIPPYVTVLYDNGETEEIPAYSAIGFALDMRIRPHKVVKIIGENCEIFNVIRESILASEPLDDLPEIKEAAADPNNDPISHSLYDFILHGTVDKPVPDSMPDPQPASVQSPGNLKLKAKADKAPPKQRNSIHG